MKKNFFSILAAAALLAGCCCETPEETVITDSTAQEVIVPGSRKDFVCNVGDRVYFEFDKSDLSEAAMLTLDKQVSWLEKYPSVSITAIGHCDERGTTEYNMSLGERRAVAVRKYLVKKGISTSRITICSKGKEDPLVMGSNEEAWAKNRATVSLISSEAVSTQAPEVAVVQN